MKKINQSNKIIILIILIKIFQTTFDFCLSYAFLQSNCTTFNNKTDSNATASKKGLGTIWSCGPDGLKPCSSPVFVCTQKDHQSKRFVPHCNFYCVCHYWSEIVYFKILSQICISFPHYSENGSSKERAERKIVNFPQDF